MNPLTTFLDDAAFAARALAEKLGLVSRPTLRIGVTGLARSGKTVFISAMVQALIRGEKLPVFRVAAEGRLRRAVIEPQPDDAVPRFAIEEHWRALADRREWPDSTRRISELRVAVDYEAKGGGERSHIIDIVDYPGEWLLDLALLDTDYRTFCADTMAASEMPARHALSSDFRALLATIDPDAPADEAIAERLADSFKAYLAACRLPPHALSALPPGRFLLAGDYEGSPALTFAPLALGAEQGLAQGSLATMMERRYDAYRNEIVAPFFRRHFARLDRQIVLVDLVSALNAGPAAVADLEAALARVLVAFRAGRNSLLSSLFAPRIDRVLFAATKADHLHHTSHDRLEATLRLIVERAMRRVEGAGAQVEAIAIASVRATREANVREGSDSFSVVVGTPAAGERIGERVFDGESEAALFTGEMPPDPRDALAKGLDLRFPRLRPPPLTRTADGRLAAVPHIRLDRALEFLMGDRLV